MAIRVVIIEDEAVYRHMLSMALSRMRGLAVVGEFADGKEGLDYCLKEKPSLLVLDLFLPGMHGLDIVREVRAGDVLLCMGAGSIGDVPLRVLELMPAQAVPKSEGGLS